MLIQKSPVTQFDSVKVWGQQQQQKRPMGYDTHWVIGYSLGIRCLFFFFFLRASLGVGTIRREPQLCLRHRDIHTCKSSKRNSISAFSFPVLWVSFYPSMFFFTVNLKSRPHAGSPPPSFFFFGLLPLLTDRAHSLPVALDFPVNSRYIRLLRSVTLTQWYP